ncbi:TonB-dependent receptor (plasmid) [Lichenicola cladoniae]|uniref:TonB-dependent receptor n=1 Tax=Lichenicola cladoniae TaxID=1484109 RepID=A0A6M8HXS1_9PROT|nr:TonB-dependent receptor [Lichenicola cladoniae]NPD68664.1 TonB-dependent receptor [Acetobacteraceae bacterium]QKE93046.1 TonB-dependent receptor [Lichenicola cladoniae]
MSRRLLFSGSVIVSGFLVSNLAAASAATPSNGPQADTSEQVIVTGTRDPHATARSSISPVTVISGAQLRSTGQADIRDALTQLAPSITRPDMAGGNANLVDAISLRSLTADQTLVLVNGKRRHGTAIIADYEGPQTGTTPVDIDMIPTASVDHVEILQDGAAALYGSDAIAGVVNIILKKNTHGGTVQAINGGYEAGDGFTTGETATYGFDLGGRGYFDLSAEVKHQDHTIRVGPDNRVNAKLNPFVGNPQSTRETIGYNAGYDITDVLQAYSFATYGHRNGEAFQNYRTPTTAPSVYPNGFVPQIALSSNDFSFTGGLHYQLPQDWMVDLSTTYGGEYDSINIFDTINTSLLSDYGNTQTRFHNMSFDDTEWTTDLGVRKAFQNTIFASPINFAIGAQYRYDTYDVGAGEPNAYYGNGPEAEDGLSPISISHAGRDVTAGYIDLSTHIVPKLQIDLAGRFEHYTDAGDTETGKVSARYDFNKFIALRGAVSNGFRAPSLAEEHYTSLGVLPTGAQGILAVDSIAARLLGAQSLKPERSTNFSVGVLINPLPRMHFAVDAYQINIRDRIALGGNYNGEAAISALAAQGISISNSVIPADVSAQYFANAASTHTHGADITWTYETLLPNQNRIDWDAELNMNETKVFNVAADKNGNALLNKQGIGYLSTYFPKNKLIVGGHWFGQKFDFALHEVRYGSALSQLQYTSGANAYSNTNFLAFQNTPQWVTNLQLGYQATKRLHLAIGANNVFDAYQRKIPPANQYLGVYQYDYTVEQVGINGGFYYLQANFNF